MANESILIRETTPEELRATIQALIHEEFKTINDEVQRIIGEDDLVSTGSACRILGVCSKVFRILVNDGHFTIFHHLKERRFIRGELIEYRNKYKVRKKVHS